MSKQIIILDSTQIDAYCTCPTQWLYGYKDSLELNGQGDENNSQKAIRMGTMGHKWLEIYYTARALGTPINDAVRKAAKFDWDGADNDPSDNHQFPLDPTERKTVLDRMNNYWMVYSQNDYIPQCLTEPDFGINEDGMLKDIVSYKPLVEQGFSYKLFESSEYLFILEGRIDLIAPTASGQGSCFTDHKFQLRERQLYPKSIQFKNYAMVTGLNFGIINYIRLHQVISNKTFVRQPIAFNSFEIKAWRSELIDIYIRVARDLKERDKNKVWNNIFRNRAACPGKFGYPCQFTHICEEPNRIVGEAVKEQMYHVRKEWRPW